MFICWCHVVPVYVCSVAGPIIGGVIGGIMMTLIFVIITLLVLRKRGKLIFVNGTLINDDKKRSRLTQIVLCWEGEEDDVGVVKAS